VISDDLKSGGLEVFIVYLNKTRFIILSAVVLTLMCGSVAYEELSAATVFQSPKPIYQGSNARKWVALTVNVDWGEEYLAGMLNFFKIQKVNAVFFVTGRWAEEHPELTRQINQDGFVLGNHGYGHSHVNNLSLADNVREVERTREIIKHLTGRDTTFYAPPYGEFNNTVLSAAIRTNHQTILWTVDTIDWQKPAPELITSRVLNKVHNGAIILMHPTDSTVKALPAILKALRDQGYQVVPLGKLIAD
jgi:probable sporulation protein (polysaccharide deacetylase family)